MREAISEWLESVVPREKYEKCVGPFLAGTEARLECSIFREVFLKIEVLPESLFRCSMAHASPFEEFFSAVIPDDPVNDVVFALVNLLSLCPVSVRSRLVVVLLKALNETQKRQITASLPDCDASYREVAKLLDRAETFMVGFSRLFRCLDVMGDEMRQFLRRKFRKALTGDVCVEYIEDMLSTLFHVKDGGVNVVGIDMLFSVLVDDFYCDSVLSNVFIVDAIRKIKIQDTELDLPVSFLKYLWIANVEIQLPGSCIWSYVHRAPGLIFEYIERCTEPIQQRAWHYILTKVTALPQSQRSLYYQTQVFYSFLSALLQKPHLLLQFVSTHIYMWFPSMLTSIRDDIGNSLVSCAFFGVALAYCRMYESVAEHFVKSINMKQFFLSVLSGIVSFDMLADMLLWVLDSSKPFPFPGFAISQVTSDYSHGFGYVFTHNISSVFAGLLILKGLQNGQISNPKLETLVRHCQLLVTSGNLFLIAQDRDEILHELMKHMDCDFVHDFVMVCLSHFSCYYAFRDYYAQIASDLPKVIDMIDSLARCAPMVDHYLWIDTEKPLSVQIINRLTAMWIRHNHSQHVRVFQLRGTEHVIDAYFVKESLTIFLDNTLCDSVSTANDICGWKMITFAVNKTSVLITLNLTAVEVPCELGSPTLVIGENDSGFDMQSLRVFAAEVDVTALFAHGPNHQDNLIASLEMPAEAFYDRSSYVSSYYLPFLDNLNQIDPQKRNVFESLIFWMSPPFSLSESKVVMCGRFLGLLDAHGGLALLIHLIAEVVLKHYELQQAVFGAVRSVVDKFPSVHRYFADHDIYELIGTMFWQAKINPDALLSAFVSRVPEGFILTNAQMTRHWFLVASVYQQEFSTAITKLASSLKTHDSLTSMNLAVIGQCNGFEFIVEALSRNISQSLPYMKSLIELALMLTDEVNAEAHIQFVFKYLMVNHLNFCEHETIRLHVDSSTSLLSEECPKDDITTGMLDLFYQLLTLYPDVHVPLEYMIPALQTCSGTAISVLGELLLVKLSPEFRYVLSLVFQNIEPSETLSTALFNIAYAAATGHVDRFEYISCSFVFLTTHLTGNEEFIRILSVHAAAALSNITTLSSVDFENILSILLRTGPKLVLEHSEISPFGEFIAAFLYQAVCLGYISQTEDLFLALFASKITPDLEVGSVCAALVYRMITRLHANNMCRKVIPFLAFCVRLMEFMIDRANMEPGEIPEAMKNSLESYIKQSLIIVAHVNSKQLTKKFVQLVPMLSITDSTTKDLVAKNNFLLKSTNFSEAVDRMYNPTSYPPTRPQNKGLLKRLEVLETMFETKVERDEEGLFTIVCGSILYQTEAVSSILPQHNTTEYVEHWSEILDTLHCPSSHIFDDIPVKYSLNSKTTRWEVRRILVPMNPAISEIYSLYWNEKYNTEPPSPRLSLSDITASTPVIATTDVKFTGDATLLSGLDLIHGLLTVFSDRIHFSRKLSAQMVSIKVSDIKAIHLIPFQHQQRGILIEENNGDSSLFAFGAHSLRNVFAELMDKHGVKVVKEQMSIDSTSKWLKGEMSNFDYLLDINIKSGRSWSDFTQTPIFPWIVTEFNDTFGTFRDLSLPLFAQTKEQQEQCEEYVEVTGFNFPCFISNVGTALYYLVRMEPLTTGELNFMSGRFDAPARTFQSFDISLSIMMTPNCRSVQELIPEAYFMPEVFSNLNNLAIPEDIQHVSLPSWAKSVHHFVRRMRKMLETKEVSEHLNEWIDLIWGVRRQGKLAAERFNHIDDIVFEFNPSEYRNDIFLLKAKSDQLHNCGQAPRQLFKGFHPAKTHRDQSKEIVLVKSKLLRPRRRTSDLLLANTVVRTSGLSNDEADVIDLSRRLTGEYEPVNVYSEGEWVMLVHTVPMISVWRHGSFFCFLRGHMEFITSIHFQYLSGFAVAGHQDGKLSVFTVEPFKFVRIIDTKIPTPVTLTRIWLSDASILVFQEEGDNTVVSLWTVNGEFLATTKLEGQVIDCAVTSFAIGTSKNIAICLMRSGHLLTMKVPSLRILDPAVDIAPNGCSITIEKNKSVVVQTERGSTLRWKITHPK